MRSAAQRASNRTVLRLLKDSWKARHTCIESIQVPFGMNSVPMSWHLTSREKRAIDEAWNSVAQSTTDAVARFVGGGPATAEGEQCVEQSGR
jgi:hypothetical protein